MRSLITRRLYLLGACVLAFGLGALFRPDLDSHGLAVPGAQRIDRLALLTSNDGAFHPDAPVTVAWVGYLYLPRPAEVYFRVPAHIGARLNVGGDVVFDTYTGAPASPRAVAYPAGGFSPIAFEITTPPNHAGYVQAALEWETPLGWQLVPAVHLYPQPVTPEAAQQAIQRSLASAALFWVGVAFGLALLATWLAPLARAAPRTTLGLALVVALALTLRLAFLADYAAQPSADVLGLGSDHRSYQGNALELLRGHWPPPQPFYVQPGMSLWLGAVYGGLWPGIRLAQLIQALLGALTSILIFDLARQAFDEWTGWAAALLWATFPLPIFYEAHLLTHGLEPAAAGVLMWLWVRALTTDISASRQAFWTIALGLALGTASLLRPTFLILALPMAISLLLVSRRPWVARVAWPMVLAAASVLPIAPVTLHNYQHSGRFQLLTSNSDVNLYLGNNRDSTGLGEYSPAFYATQALSNQGKTSYFEQTLIDIRDDPARWLQLMLRKTFLYLGDPELPNNVDFYTEGLAISPILSALPLRFGLLTALAAAGMLLAQYQSRKNQQPLPAAFWIVAIYLLSQIAITIVYHVFSRFRAPVYPALPIFAAFALRTLLATLRQRQWRPFAAALGVTAGSALAIWLMPVAAENVMSRPVTSALPATTVPLSAPMGEALTLVGYDPLPVVAPDEPFTITLYWQAHDPIPSDLYGSVQLFGDSVKVTQGDQAIGTGSFPDYATSQWQPGQIVRDTYTLRMPADAPVPMALNVLVAAYERDTGNRLGETNFGPLSLTRRAPLALPDEAIEVDARFGTATLVAYAISGKTLTLYWLAGEPMQADGVVFIHLFDPDNNFVAGSDSRPRTGTYSTLAWQPGEAIEDLHTLPTVSPGVYSIKLGVYDAATLTRFKVETADERSAPDDVLLLGEVEIR